MAIINFTGFEQGPGLTGNGGDDYQPFGGSGGSVQSTIKKHGAYAAEFIKTTTGSCYVSVNGERATDGQISLNSGSWATLYLQGYFRYTTKPSANSEQIMEVHGTGGDPIAELHIDVNGKLRVYDFNNYGTPTLLATGTTTLSANTWYKISFKVVAGSSGSYELLIDDAAELSASRSWAITLNLRNVFLGARRDRNGESMTFYWDDYASSGTAYPFSTGEYAVGILKPNANGSTMSWTAGTGASDYTQVDEIPWSDSDYVQSPTSGNPNVALFNFQSRADASLSTGDILAIKAIMLNKEASSVSSNTKVRVRSGGSNSDSAGFNGSTASIGLGRLLENDPSTGIAWTGAGIDAIEAGAVEDNAVAIQLFNAMVHVLYEISTAQNYQQDLDEVVSLSDSAKRTAGKTLEDTLTLVDTALRQTTAYRAFVEVITLVADSDAVKIASQQVEETITLVDVAIKRTTSKAIEEVITLVETLARQVALTKAFVETIVLVDSIAMLKSINVALLETVTLVETQIRSTAKRFTEAITLTETITRVKTYLRAFVDTVVLVASAGTLKQQFKALTEVITLVDRQIKTIGKVLTETISLVTRFLGLLNGNDISYRSKYENRPGTYIKKYLDF